MQTWNFLIAENAEKILNFLTEISLAINLNQLATTFLRHHEKIGQKFAPK